ncbi:protein DCL homolog, chloroplastic-like [Phragmites australis]|uniref:protein DCL homolog, chloroplastic-like n=1 Tax=Phragmites australis TaxID=29695 RepID=UPI002D77D0D5|nr:protein DCL homolog, chloroplastic-like [Phragmites australis]
MAAALTLAAAPLLLRASRFAPWAAPVPRRRRLLSGPPTAGEPPPSAPKLADPPGVWAPVPSLPWSAAEAEILRDVDPVVQLIKDILHSDRYGDGECLCPKDEDVVVEKLLAYHPHAQDKIGCGLDAIMVDRHPEFRKSRCLFVVRTDGVWIDFSYQKCLRAYIREKYPSHAERFIREHFKRT